MYSDLSVLAKAAAAQINDDTGRPDDKERKKSGLLRKKSTTQRETVSNVASRDAEAVNFFLPLPPSPLPRFRFHYHRNVVITKINFVDSYPTYE